VFPPCAAPSLRDSTPAIIRGEVMLIESSFLDICRCTVQHLAGEIKQAVVFSQPSSHSRQLHVASAYDFQRSWQALQVGTRFIWEVGDFPWGRQRNREIVH